MSRLAITFAQSVNGDWYVLATPEIPAAKQKEIVKKIKATGTFKDGKKTLSAAKAYCLGTTGPIRRYDRIASTASVASVAVATQPDQDDGDNKGEDTPPVVAPVVAPIVQPVAIAAGVQPLPNEQTRNGGKKG